MEDNPLIIARREKFEELAATGRNMYPNAFKPKHKMKAIVDKFSKHKTREEITEAAGDEEFVIAGRIMFLRKMGKLCFVRVKDDSASIQLAISLDGVGEESFDLFKKYSDLGDLVGAKGTMGMTNTGEMTLQCTSWELLNKTARPLPDKFHGLTDTEVRYRQRYVDLIMNDDTREIFKTRSAIMRQIRNHMESQDFMEVETPILQVLQGGADAKPFETFHNALSLPMFMRVAPELYLKRLTVGGFERVYEIGKLFRNEGLSTRHNPEFTSMEWYAAYWTFTDQMNFIEEMFKSLCDTVCGKRQIPYGEETVDMDDWTRMTMRDAVKELGGATEDDLATLESIKAFAIRNNVKINDDMPWGAVLNECFEELCEHQLKNPTFITEHPKAISPLAKSKADDPEFTERAELFILGREYANLFSELNDPVDQAERFREQMEKAAKGDDEAMPYDEDFVRALEYGLPPTAGAGLGIDRLTMLLTNQASIRDVILFPHMRPEKEQVAESEGASQKNAS